MSKKNRPFLCRIGLHRKERVSDWMNYEAAKSERSHLNLFGYKVWCSRCGLLRFFDPSGSHVAMAWWEIEYSDECPSSEVILNEI